MVLSRRQLAPDFGEELQAQIGSVIDELVEAPTWSSFQPDCGYSLCREEIRFIERKSYQIACVTEAKDGTPPVTHHSGNAEAAFEHVKNVRCRVTFPEECPRRFESLSDGPKEERFKCRVCGKASPDRRCWPRGRNREI